MTSDRCCVVERVQNHRDRVRLTSTSAVQSGTKERWKGQALLEAEKLTPTDEEWLVRAKSEHHVLHLKKMPSCI